ncbi:MAG TPA: hypothetical protein VGR35_20595 [Tepidisphaeraceae bacterium]|nr:hypothetical protein [Tepidisphaeraceae bacterium]
MDDRSFQPLLRTLCADGMYIFCAERSGWTIRREGVVICSGTSERQSIEDCVKRFVALTSPANRPAQPFVMA